MPNTVLPAAPAAVSRGLCALDCLARVLAISDGQAWETLARPGPGGLADLLFIIHGELSLGLVDVVRLPES